MNILTKLLNYTSGLHLLWTGNNGWLLWDGYHLIACDLDLYNLERKNKSNIDINLLAKHLSLLLITHSHEDHFNSDTIKKLIQYNSNCHYIIPQSCKEKAHQIIIPTSKIIFCNPHMNIDFENIKIHTMRAIHGHKCGTVYRNASSHDCGYIINIANHILYQPGDTILLEEHLNMTNIDTLFISPTEHNTYIDNSLSLIKMIKPKIIIAQHFNTYHETKNNKFWTHGYVKELKPFINENIHYIIPSQSKIIHLDNIQKYH